MILLFLGPAFFLRIAVPVLLVKFYAAVRVGASGSLFFPQWFKKMLPFTCYDPGVARSGILEEQEHCRGPLGFFIAARLLCFGALILFENHC
jgi:hypothetical protein